MNPCKSSIEPLKPHTHAGKRLAVGDRLDLNDASARWLITQGTAKAATQPPIPNPPAVMLRPVFPQLQPPKETERLIFPDKAASTSAHAMTSAIQQD